MTIWYWLESPREATSATPGDGLECGRTVKSCNARSSARSIRPVLSFSTLIDPAHLASGPSVGETPGGSSCCTSQLLEHPRPRPVDVGALAEEA